MRKSVRHSWLPVVLGGILILPGCSGTTVDLDTGAHRQMLEQDRAMAGDPADHGQVISLSLEEAVQRAYAYNLDVRVAAFEAVSQEENVTLAKMAALPGVEASAGYSGRSNNGAASSRSVLTGQQSLEPSQSTDRHRRTAALEANWNLLDAALALSDARSADEDAKIAAERWGKVVQNVERDVYAAYWRAQAYQDAKKRTGDLLESVNGQIGKLDRAANDKLIAADQAGEKAALLADRQRTLRDLYDRLQLSEIELKSMLSLPHDSTLVLTTPRRRIDSDVEHILAASAQDQEWTALNARPEMREEILKKNISVLDTRREVMRSFPGLGFTATRQYDSNSFLMEPNWSAFSATIAQSITSLLTLPDRYRISKNKETLADARRQALAAAVMAQVHIARARLNSANENNEAAALAQRSAGRRSAAMAGRKAQGFISGQDAFLARLDSDIESIRASLAYADLQEAYAAMKTTLGQSVTGVLPSARKGGAA